MEGVFGLDGDRADGCVVLFQPSRRSYEGPSGPESGDEMRDSSGGLRKDLDRRPLVMGSGVGGIRILVGIEVFVGVHPDELTDHQDRAVGSLACLAVNDLSSIGGDQRFALGAHVARHHEPHAIAFGRADQRVCDTGVA